MDKTRAYEVLGLPQGADEDAVKAAYKASAQKYNVDNYEAGPLRQDAEAKMEELNAAFDLLMGYLRTGTIDAPPTGHNAPTAGRYAAIRQLINSGRVDEALTELSAMPAGATDAEWNFLMGSAYYYKGWLDQALRYFQEAARLAPDNPEYQAALRNLQSSAGGAQPGNPYAGGNGGGAQAVNCACNTCSLMCCMDTCCSMCRG